MSFIKRQLYIHENLIINSTKPENDNILIISHKDSCNKITKKHMKIVKQDRKQAEKNSENLE